MEVQIRKGTGINTNVKSSTNKNNLRVVAYIRVSTDHDDQLASLDNQRLHYQNKISNHEGWELVNIYSDEGISGTRDTARQDSWKW